MLRNSIEPDPARAELNQQSEAAQALYQHIVDVRINISNTSINLEEGITGNAVITTQLNTPVEVPEHYELGVRVLMPTGWQDFITNENNHLLAAEKEASGYCPAPNSPLYLNTFGKNDVCLRMTIEDGGPNDTDETINDSITVTSGVILKALEETGTGTWSVWLSLLLLLRLTNKE